VDRDHPLSVPERASSVGIDVEAPDASDNPAWPSTLQGDVDENKLHVFVLGYDHEDEQHGDQRATEALNRSHTLDPLSRTASPDGSSLNSTAVEDIFEHGHALPVR
jgi:hypothetical protein